MQQTIGGRLLSDVLAELAKPFPESDYRLRDDGDNKPYLPYRILQQRFDNMVPLANRIITYDATCIQGSVPFLQVKCCITLLDDTNAPLLRVEGYGGTSMIVVRSSGNFLNVGNDYEKACKDALKRTYKMLGMNQYPPKQLRGQRGNSYTDSSATDSSSGSQASRRDQTFELLFTSSFSGGPQAYKADVMIDSKSYKLVLLSNSQRVFAQKMPNFLTTDFVGRKGSIVGYTTVFHNEAQVIFTGWPVKSHG